MRTNIARRYVVTMLLMFLLGVKAFGATSAEYAAAGLQLYNQKNYSQAIQYYSAAISLDPNNTSALQGRANSYYSLGQNQEALNDYQKVQAIAPNPQLGQFIQALQAKVGTAVPAAGGIASSVNAAPAATTGGSYDQGVALYQQKQYAAAVPLLQKATQENPNDSKAFYYLGAAYMMLGDNKNAALNLAISNQKQPNPSVEAYVTQLKARLSPEDQQWVDGQLAASTTASSARAAAPASNKKMGIRFEPAISLLDMKDFTTNAQTYQAGGTALRAVEPDVTYTGHVPTGSVNVCFEPVYKLSPNLELGLPIGFMPAGTADDNLSAPSAGSTFIDSFGVNAIMVGLNIRYLIGTGDFQPHISAGPLLAPMNITYALNYTNGSGTATASGDFAGFGFGGQVELGLDWHLGDTFAISPFVGYQLLSANSFTSTISSSVGGAGATGQTATLSLVPVSYNGTAIGSYIFPVAGGNVVPLGYPAPTGTAPLSVDLSGIKAGIQISAFF